MYYYGARYYDPRISIFISVDPLAEHTMEPYLYTGNNPIMFTDPTGMSKDGVYPKIWTLNKNTGKPKFLAIGSTPFADSVLSNFTISATANIFLSKFMKKGDQIGRYTAKNDGVFSNYALDINFVDFKGDASARGAWWKRYQGAFTPDIDSDGKLRFLIYLPGEADGSMAAVLETLGHEALLHGTATKIQKVIDFYVKNSPEATRDAIRKKVFNSEDIDHSAMKNKDLNHEGFNLYNSFRNELEYNEGFLNKTYEKRNSFKANEKHYEELYVD